MNWDDLKIIEALGTAGSLSGAARQLKLNHSTVYRRLGDLENTLGTRLFDRHRTGYQPTASGEQTIRLAKAMKQEITDLTRKLSGQDMRLEGTLRIATADTLFDMLAPLLARFKDAFPGIRLEVTTSNEFVNLTKRDCDIALRVTNTPTDTLVGRKLGEIPTAIYASRTYLDGKGDVTDLKDHDWIGFDDALSHLEAARWLAKTVPVENIVLRADTLPGIRAALRNNLGLAALPCFLAAGQDDIQCLMAPIDSFKADLWLLTHEDLKNTARVRAFMDFVQANQNILNRLFQTA